MIASLQNQVIIRLKAAHPGAKVEPFPDRPEAAKMTGSQNIFIHYLGTEYTSPEELGPIPNPADYPGLAEVRFQLILATLGINGGDGGLSLMEAVVAELSGWRPGGFLEIRPEHSGLFGRQGNLWLYQSIFSVTQN